jgi:hypothetical protein
VDRPVFFTPDGQRLDRHGAARLVRLVAIRAGITKPVAFGSMGDYIANVSDGSPQYFAWATTVTR